MGVGIAIVGFTEGKEMNRLYRSRTNRVIAGIAGGLGEYFHVDPVIIRLLWVLLGFAGGSGILLYLIAWILIPEEPIFVREESDMSSTTQAGGGDGANDWAGPREDSFVDERERRRRLLGGLLLLTGLLLLVEKMSAWIDLAWLLPVALIAAGFVVLVRGWK